MPVNKIRENEKNRQRTRSQHQTWRPELANRVRKILLVFAILCSQVISVSPCFGDTDALADDKIKGLKELHAIALVFRLNTPQEIVSLKELGNMVEVDLHRIIPELTIRQPEDAQAWLELSLMATAEGGSVTLSMYRWVTLLDSGETLFAKVWDDSRLALDGFSKTDIQETLDTLLTSLAADYLRAKR